MVGPSLYAAREPEKSYTNQNKKLNMIRIKFHQKFTKKPIKPKSKTFGF